MDKQSTLRDAVHRLVRPGQHLHLGYGGGRPNATVAEIIRQFRGTAPGFTVSAHGFVNTQHALLACGLVRRLVVAFAGENYPNPRPNPVLQRALHAGAVELENWSIWTLTARLMAGALGVPFQPVRSLTGSDLATEHDGRGFQWLTAPDGTRTPAVAALRPDLTLVHGLAADHTGNVILPPPYGEGAWGAAAAREGVLATVESLVDAEEIRAHNTLPMIPGHLVRAVCVAPFGSHPYGLATAGMPGVVGYREDNAFMAELCAAARDEKTMATWVEEWITSVPHHDGFLKRLGTQTLAQLRDNPPAPPAARTGPPTVDELMTLATARVLRDRVRAGRHDIMLSGIGYAHLAAWTAAQRLRAEGTPITLAAELGMAGFLPAPGDPYLFARQNFDTCLQLTDVTTVLARDAGGPATSMIGVLGAGQVDRTGNLNSTYSPTGEFIVGSGGANDIASAAEEIVVVLKHTSHRLVERVGYITAPGRRVTAIVTSEAVLERDADGEFIATRYLAAPDAPAAAARIRERTGWPVRLARQLEPEPAPDQTDLLVLRAFDPTGHFLRG